MKKFSRVLSMLLAFVLVVGLCPTIVSTTTMAANESISITYSNMFTQWETSRGTIQFAFRFTVETSNSLKVCGLECWSEGGFAFSREISSTCNPLSSNKEWYDAPDILLNALKAGETYYWRVYYAHEGERYYSQESSFVFLSQADSIIGKSLVDESDEDHAAFFDNQDKSDTVATTPRISSQPFDVTVNQGDFAKLSVTAISSNSTLSYQWYSNSVKSNTSGALIRGATSTTYYAPTEVEGTSYYYCVVTNTLNGDSKSVTSNAVQVTVKPITTELKEVETVYRSGNISTYPLDWFIDNKSSTAYDPELAELAMAFSDAAYDKQLIAKSLGKDNHDFEIKGYGNYTGFNFLNPAYVIAENKMNNGDKIVAVIIRGTKMGTGDVLTDLAAGITGTGFAVPTKQISDEIFKIYGTGSLPRGTKFFFTGHSYGGAVANMLAAAFSDGYPQSDVFCYTFAAPNVNTGINLNPSKYRNIFNIVNNADHIPKLLPLSYKYGSICRFTADMYTDAFMLDNHAGSVYLDFLSKHNSLDKNGYLDDSRTFKNFMLYGVLCPVDVDIYDDNGTLIAQFIDNQPIYHNGGENKLVLYTVEDEKYVLMPVVQKLEIELTGTGTGVMDCVIYDISIDDEIQREIIFKDVPLDKGKMYYGSVSGVAGAIPESYNLTADDGTIIPYSYVTGENEGLPFTDVSQTDWFYNDVKIAYESGLINGTSATTFSPNNNLTYAEAIKLAACMHQRHTTGSVTLANGIPWYQSYVDYAKANYIISKDYDWNIAATRAGYMEIFANALPDSALSAINTIADGTIPDVPMTNSSAAAIYKLYRAGIVQGSDAAHNCNPSSNIKRSEVAAILTRMMDGSARVSFDIS